MKIFNKPENLNGSELIAELKQAGLTVNEIVDFANGTIGFETDDEAKASKIVASHNGNTDPEQSSIEFKLSTVGLNLSDLKAALGL